MVKYFSTKTTKSGKVIKGVIATSIKNAASFLDRQGKKLKSPYSIREITKSTAKRKALKFGKMKGSRFVNTKNLTGLYISKKR
jgi:hypothetical protein